jgi:hypothetical protein
MAGKAGHQPVADKAMGLPGRGSAIGRVILAW